MLTQLEAAVESAADVAAAGANELVDVLVLKLATGGETKLGGLRKLEMEVLGEDEEWNYYVSTDTESRQRFSDVLDDYSQLPPDSADDWDHPRAWAALVDNIDDVVLYGPSDRQDESLATLDFDRHNEVECLLWPAKYKTTARQRIARVLEALAEVGDSAQVLDVDRRPEWLTIRVSVNQEGLETLLDHNAVQSVLAPPRASITPETLASATPPTPLPQPISQKIGVVDGIVSASNPFVSAYVVDAQDFPAGHQYPLPDSHGTQVAGVAIWGDLDSFVGAGPTPTAAPVVSARVLELDPLDPTSTKVAGSVVPTIEAAIRWLASQGVRIVTMSINYPGPAASPTRTPLTYLVDQLVRELKLVVVVSTGNFDPGSAGYHVLDDYPDYLTSSTAEVASPGDAATVVTVGSFAKRDVPSTSSPTAYSVAKANQPSHFTRLERQRRGQVARRKPEFMAHGGNGVWEKSTSSLLLNEPGTSVVVPQFGSSGHTLTAANGTSFSAPAVAHEVALISHRYPSAGANMLRALTALSARPEVQTPNPTVLPAMRLCAYGVPRAERILESDSERVVLTFEGDIATNTTVVHPIPIPAEYAESFGTQEFTLAVAFDPPVRRTRREYMAGRMRAELVRGLNQQDVVDIYARQPTQPEIDDDPTLTKRPLPEGMLRPDLEPPAKALSANTLIVRRYPRGGDWDRQHGNYFLVLTHHHNPSTQAQRREYPLQGYAAAIELRLHDRPDIDLYALVRARLRARNRART